MGVPNIWLIDPYMRKAYTYTSSGLHEIPATTLAATNSPVRIDLTDLFAKLDERKAANPA